MTLPKQEKAEESKATALTLEQLDEFVVSLLEALKDINDPAAVAEVKDIILTNELIELLLFVGITSKQVGDIAIFTWTDAIVKKPHGR